MRAAEPPTGGFVPHVMVVGPHTRANRGARAMGTEVVRNGARPEPKARGGPAQRARKKGKGPRDQKIQGDVAQSDVLGSTRVIDRRSKSMVHSAPFSPRDSLSEKSSPRKAGARAGEVRMARKVDGNVGYGVTTVTRARGGRVGAGVTGTHGAPDIFCDRSLNQGGGAEAGVRRAASTFDDGDKDRFRAWRTSWARIARSVAIRHETQQLKLKNQQLDQENRQKMQDLKQQVRELQERLRRPKQQQQEPPPPQQPAEQLSSTLARESGDDAQPAGQQQQQQQQQLPSEEDEYAAYVPYDPVLDQQRREQQREQQQRERQREQLQREQEQQQQRAEQCSVREGELASEQQLNPEPSVGSAARAHRVREQETQTPQPPVRRSGVPGAAASCGPGQQAGLPLGSRSDGAEAHVCAGTGAAQADATIEGGSDAGLYRPYAAPGSGDWLDQMPTRELGAAGEPVGDFDPDSRESPSSPVGQEQQSEPALGNDEQLTQAQSGLARGAMAQAQSGLARGVVTQAQSGLAQGAVAQAWSGLALGGVSNDDGDADGVLMKTSGNKFVGDPASSFGIDAGDVEIYNFNFES
eukprot:CAMPEP_0119408956 /NCGR_PEP_ID=MMETSP1335-20130426/2356_1 /TAXON_ID=259385 /ORGANISM="Chrysoculter rhomboideus, Strain RCC1486" /LENGTH=580 /DNA_ID=CAMNT_0007433249 /DNA_START=25 /DNA_END=1763 /DNA_ORIENTATION=+